MFFCTAEDQWLVRNFLFDQETFNCRRPKVFGHLWHYFCITLPAICICSVGLPNAFVLLLQRRWWIHLYLCIYLHTLHNSFSFRCIGFALLFSLCCIGFILASAFCFVCTAFATSAFCAPFVQSRCFIGSFMLLFGCSFFSLHGIELLLLAGSGPFSSFA